MHSRSVVGDPWRTKLAVDVGLDFAWIIFLTSGDCCVRPPAVLDLRRERHSDSRKKRKVSQTAGWSVGQSVGVPLLPHLPQLPQLPLLSLKPLLRLRAQLPLPPLL